MRLSFGKRLSVFMISLVGFLISVGIPAGFLIHIIYDNMEITNKKTINISFIGVFVMLLVLIIYVKWIKKVFDRKLQAMAVVDELGLYSARPVLWNRLLKTIEYTFPAGLMALFLFGMSKAFTPYSIFKDLFGISIWFLVFLTAGSLIYLIGDYVKLGLMNKQKIEDTLDVELKKDKLYIKRLKQGKEKELEALLIQQQLEKLKNDNQL